ncbi:putative major vault protein [Leptomonas seymouri]|uniref:Putative major vault protein n=1 Tax=Leptomonas seymouri TaxID=5684 RepID=A0A0N0P6Z8_LEPSE|nr:putative major vault protein [Leptomonas seymouri]|eukprot:KPI87757.1 putative major vault protein [Leptomonas seymouri]
MSCKAATQKPRASLYSKESKAEALVEGLLRLPPFHYTHLTNENNNTTELIIGPVTRPIASHETIVLPPTSFVTLSPTQFCLIANPHRSAVNPITGAMEPVRDAYGQVQVQSGEEEYRWHVAPFPLYPEERLVRVEELRVLSATQALQIVALATYDVLPRVTGPSLSSPPSWAPSVKRREAGERFLFYGPGTYYPRVEERVEEVVSGLVVSRGTGLWCCTSETFTDGDSGIEHYAGEQYLRLKEGMCFLQPFETLLSTQTGTILTKEEGLHVKAVKTYTDPRSPFCEEGVVRKAGEVFLVVGETCPCFVPHPYDKVVKRIRRTHLSASQFAVVLNSAAGAGTDAAKLRKVVTNTSFFLEPGEKLEGGRSRNAFLLSAHQAVLVTATGNFTDISCDPSVERYEGDRWLVHGPCSFIPNSFMRVVPDAKTKAEVRCRYLLGENEGLYVRNTVTGVVRCVPGPCSYMLAAEEELWEKPLSAQVELHLPQLVSHSAYIEEEGDRPCGALHGLTERAVSYSIPHRSVTQLYNYKTQVTRIVFGPDRVLLEPDEAFTVVSLSGSPWDPEKPNKCLPKQPNHITALHLFLGPSNMTDVVHVETRDHAQLALQLCYDWYFDVSHGDPERAKKCFSVNDFVGDCCSYIASRIRAAVASMPFEEFHKNSARCLRRAVFDVDPETGRPNEVLCFPSNHLVITSVDTQEMEVLDERTRQGLQKSVKVAIEITTHAQEAEAQQEAMKREQRARGRLERQRMQDQVANEEQRRVLLNAESSGLSIVSLGRSRAIAEALSTASCIEGEAALEAASIRAAKEQLLYSAMTEMQQRKKQLLSEQEKKVVEMTQKYEKEMSEVHHRLIGAVVDALGPATIAEMARAGPELQAKLLSNLGLEGYLVTDGSSPINLFNTADGMLGH